MSLHRSPSPDRRGRRPLWDVALELGDEPTDLLLAEHSLDRGRGDEGSAFGVELVDLADGQVRVAPSAAAGTWGSVSDDSMTAAVLPPMGGLLLMVARR